MFTPSDDPVGPRKDLTKSPRASALNSPRLRPTLERGPNGELVTSRSEIKPDGGKGEDVDPTKIRKGLWDLIALTISMAGAQVAWTVELGYGTPFLLGLGLSAQLTSLVWLAGPISGAISDSSTSKYRRRYWVVTSTVVLAVAAIGLAYAEKRSKVEKPGKPIAVRHKEQPQLKSTLSQTRNTAIGLAVFAFYLLDFALNALQGSLRNLLLDVTPAEQLGKANAWHGRMLHAGNIIGFTFGFIKLADWRILRPLGGDQFRKVCIIAVIILVATVWITCVTQHEKERPQNTGDREESGMMEVVRNISRAVSTLPRPVRRVCYVQVCAFMGWFPFLFYSTTWVGEIMAYELDRDPDPEEATRKGEFALLIYSLVAVIAGTALPYLAAMDARLLKQIDKEIEDAEAQMDAELVKIRQMVREWKSEAARKGRPLQLPRMPFMLRNIWTAALLLFGVIMMSTFFITTVFQATIAIALLGICWAVACWVPFAIIMQFLREMDDAAAAERKSQDESRGYASTSSGPRSASVINRGSRPLHARIASTPAMNWRPAGGPQSAIEPTERTSLVRRHSMVDVLDSKEEEIVYESTQPVAGGTILGIHNLAIVMPQFLIALISSAIFRIADQSRDPSAPEYVYYGKNGVGWVLRFGGICAFLGAAICRRVPPTKTEKEMRWRLAEMKEAKEHEGEGA
ncbi:hypothetical protein FRB90_009533 [Tulasnella sp. 427]|nr:hypothetical protein FRB90_009533 [Tulasnella sp. 427]